jgi:hypothetical protein
VGLREAAIVARERALDASVHRIDSPASAVVRGVDLRAPLIGAHALPLAALSIGRRPQRHPVLAEHAIDDRSADVAAVREFVDALTGEVALDEIVDIERREFRGHVWNIETERGWYIAEGIVTHNCRCRTWIRPRIRRASER